MTVIRRALVVWAALIVATAASYVFGADHLLAELSPEIAPSVAIVLALVKVVLIGLYFMEIGGAPRALRVAFGAWVVVIGGALLLLELL